MTQVLSPAPSSLRNHANLHTLGLLEQAIKRSEGHLVGDGIFVAHTGIHTGRSAKDKYIVRDGASDGVWWESSYQKALEPHYFEALLKDVQSYLNTKETFVLDAWAGADPRYRIGVRVVSEFAWHTLFSKHLFIPTSPDERNNFQPDWTVLSVPSYKAGCVKHGSRSETQIVISFSKRLVVIVGTSYAGEIKKSIFTVLNHLLPAQGVLPMHCSANVGQDGDVALFFGMSGTGKTTLSNDPSRNLIGDDEHGWSDEGIFNFEGGCYAKVINLSKRAEPDIYRATHTFGAVLENVVFDKDSRALDFTDTSLTENTRAAYPLTSIANAQLPSVAGHPKNIIFLTADAFGVLPPVAKLTPEQAVYYFLNGYTAKVAGTEKGILEPQASFETAFSAPFITREPHVYAKLLNGKIKQYGTKVWLVNTGWTGGPYGVGQRFKLEYTRAIIKAIVESRLNHTHTFTLPYFNLAVPILVPEVPTHLLNPRETWEDKDTYDVQAKKLVRMCVENFKAFEARVNDAVKQASPNAKMGVNNQ
jgi:phosphoenolpyruvate carboxykinase (ATP)